MQTGKTAATAAEILRDILSEKMTRNPSFSLRALARDLGVSHTYLSLVLNGKKTLSVRKAIQFAHLLRLDQRASAAMLEASSRETGDRVLAKAKASPSARTLRERVDYFELEADNFRLLTEWYHLPILDLTLTRGFKSDIRWIAQKLMISGAQAKDAVDRLLRLGLLEENSGRWSKAKKFLTVQPKQPDSSVRAYHRQMIGKALASLDSGRSEKVAARDVSAVTIPIDPRKIPEARKKIAAFRRSLWKYLTDGDCTELYQLNIQLFPLTHPDNEKGVVLKRGAK